MADFQSILRSADEQLSAMGVARRSLCPKRDLATSLLDLGVRLQLEVPRGCEMAFARGLASIADAEVRNFPENIFWDFDYTAASLLREATASSEPARHLSEVCGLIVALQDLFGSATEIRFRYGHDFIYGFDWAKWVRKQPDQRASVGPFDLEFLTFLHQRGHELLELIAEDDAKYPTLRTSEPRNPFEFSRDPEAEAALHESLARDGLLPVESWRVDATPVWDKPFQRLRRERAMRLGF
ncbi:MAG: ferrochelatase [Myxococcales bacterium]|nr:ferrochelatase [Myxococcales bacterium]